MNNQTNSSNSKFQMPQAPQPQHVQSESLLFNDISEEINADMRNKLHDFLQVLPYRTFKMELANFFKHIDRLKKEAERNGTNISRLTNCSQMVPSNSRPCTSFRAPSTMSLISCNRNNTIRQPESNFQSIPLNSFKPSVHIELESNEVVLPRSNQSNHVSQSSSNMDTTIIKVSHRKNNIAKTKGNHKHLNPPETVFKNTFDPNDAYSNIKLVVENKSAFASHQNKNINNGCYSIDSSLLETVGLSNKNKTTKSDANGNNGKRLEKYLSKWSVNMKIIKSKKSCVLLTGTLLKADQSTVEEEHHNADLIICRKEKDLLKTNNGLYRLLGKIIGGSPDELYQESLSKNGFPVKWKILQLHQ
ncbi:uncharacterized protein LOC112692734 isoform X2 [Sipha flava]|uniref:Uncharacterized protein LOC112692734 isoform X2 n=1 Tax=Sipha flava TaxID=143950 RepID=A0A8B8GL25_9HEMI|nr:uncharacterized protein LOC112692734 isoform X2 [Sipha flava]